MVGHAGDRVHYLRQATLQSKKLGLSPKNWELWGTGDTYRAAEMEEGKFRALRARSASMYD